MNKKFLCLTQSSITSNDYDFSVFKKYFSNSCNTSEQAIATHL